MMSDKLTVDAFFSFDSIAICSLNGNLKAMRSALFSSVSVTAHVVDECSVRQLRELSLALNVKTLVVNGVTLCLESHSSLVH